jgi:hypothetical protein
MDVMYLMTAMHGLNLTMCIARGSRTSGNPPIAQRLQAKTRSSVQKQAGH